MRRNGFKARHRGGTRHRAKAVQGWLRVYKIKILYRVSNSHSISYFKSNTFFKCLSMVYIGGSI